MASLLTVAALSHLVPETIQASSCGSDFRAPLISVARVSASGTDQASMQYSVHAANNIAA